MLQQAKTASRRLPFLLPPALRLRVPAWMRHHGWTLTLDPRPRPHARAHLRLGRVVKLVHVQRVEVPRVAHGDGVAAAAGRAHGGDELHVHQLAERVVRPVKPAWERMGSGLGFCRTCMAGLQRRGEERGVWHLRRQDDTHHPEWSMTCRSSSIGGCAPYFSTCMAAVHGTHT